MKTIKTILLSTFIMLSSIVFAQEFPINEKTGKISYEGVVKIDGASQSDLYVKANEWFVNAFNSANSVIQMQDKESGKIMGKGSIPVTRMGYPAGYFYFTVKFTAREGRYKYVITDIYHDEKDLKSSGGAMENEKPDCSSMLMLKRQWKKLKIQADNQFIELSSNLANHMQDTASEDDDW